VTDFPPPPGAPYPHERGGQTPPSQPPPSQPPPSQPPPPQPTPPQPAPPQPPIAPQSPGSPPPRRTGALIATAVVVGVLAVAVAVLATVLIVGGDDETATTTIPGTLPTTTVIGGGTIGGNGGGSTGGTTGDTGGASLASVQEVEQILGQSAAGRAEVVDVGSGVLSCAMPLDEASARMSAVASNRQAVLSQVNALGASGSATLDRAVDLLGQSIVSSLEANANYQAWIGWLGATQAATYNSGCPPSGAAPTNGDYDAAISASGRATAAKAEFVSLFNPIAQAFGLRTWSDSEI
jgi:hypothetical protein